MKIRNIIFDLGGVLYDIDYHLSIEAFKSLGIENFDHIFTQAGQTHLFDQFDKGLITKGAFRDEIRSLCGLPLSDEEIDRAWNAMLLKMHSYSLELLSAARLNYRTFLLSNTNEIHFPVFLQHLKEKYNLNGLHPYFEKQYLSFELGMRKPNPEIFKFVLTQNGLAPKETLFIDDSPQHVAGALKSGIKAYWLDTKNQTVADLFSNGQLKPSFLNHLLQKYDSLSAQ